MKLKNLVENVNVLNSINFNENLNIKDITCSSKEVKNNFLFFAISGYNTNGTNYISESIKCGATAIVCNNKNYKKILSLYHSEKVCFLFVEDERKTLSLIASNFYQNSHKNLKIISVVGTNGKTSTAHIMFEILKTANKKVGLIGTNEILYSDKVIENSMTTPDPILLHKLFFDMQKDGIEYVVMEVSAHAIFLNKMYGIICETTIFTNFSQDHLDFFKTMEKYKNVKVGYFDKKYTKSCILNIDDVVGREILNKTNLPAITYGIKNPCDVFAVNISMDLKGSEFIVNAFDDVFKIKSKLTCLFNVYNMLSCISCAFNLGINKCVIKKALQNIDNINGRFNLVDKKQNFNVIIDYAHTPKSLESLLLNVKSLSKGKVITVFGCPGNRDELKREQMGNIASKLSDYVILTSDNPQYENSYRIMRDIERGIINTNCAYKLIDDRSTAISLALSLATPKSNVIIVGKGMENYQNINGEHIEYNDYDEVVRQLSMIKKLKLDSKFENLT